MSGPPKTLDHSKISSAGGSGNRKHFRWLECFEWFDLKFTTFDTGGFTVLNNGASLKWASPHHFMMSPSCKPVKGLKFESFKRLKSFEVWNGRPISNHSNLPHHSIHGPCKTRKKFEIRLKGSQVETLCIKAHPTYLYLYVCVGGANACVSAWGCFCFICVSWCVLVCLCACVGLCVCLCNCVRVNM